jgi:serine/threonine protein kinase
MANCPNCETVLDTDSRFCKECGTDVSHISGRETDDESLNDQLTVPAPEAPESLNDVRTIPAPNGVGSLNDMPTVAAPGAGRRPGAASGALLTDRYELLEEIGRGGFATVHKARDRKLGRTVAIKRLRSDGTGAQLTARDVERFRREAQAIAGLNHRNIVQVHDTDRDADGDYIVMEYVTGGTLRNLLRDRGALPQDEAVMLMQGLCRGLAYAHRHNVIHRDVTPRNIMLADDGEGGFVPKLVDFGLARAGGESGLSMTGYGMGTPTYMPPEQKRDAKSVNHTADVYALGKVLYEMLYGEIAQDVDPVKVPPVLYPVIAKCIKALPEERYFSVGELLAALESAVQSSHVEQPAGLQTTVRNACPDCGSGNADDARFCENCSAGLTRACPECEKETSIHKKFCGQCATDIEAFGQFGDALTRMGRYAAERKWSRVQKEAELLPDDPRLPGEKGQAVRATVQQLFDDASTRRQECNALREQVHEAMASEEYERAISAADELAEVDILPEELTDLALKLAPDIERRDFDAAVQAAEEAMQRGDCLTVVDVWKDFLCDHMGAEQEEDALQALHEAHQEVFQMFKVRGAANMANGLVDAALVDLESAERLTPGDADVKKQLEILRQVVMYKTYAQKSLRNGQYSACLRYCCMIAELCPSCDSVRALRVRAESGTQRDDCTRRRLPFMLAGFPLVVFCGPFVYYLLGSAFLGLLAIASGSIFCAGYTRRRKRRSVWLFMFAMTIISALLLFHLRIAFLPIVLVVLVFLLLICILSARL